jgi:SAM-dependent methyltransferase
VIDVNAIPPIAPEELNTLRRLTEIAQTVPDNTLDQFHSLISAHQYRLLHALTHEFVRPGGRVLDWGAGNGHYSYFLERAGYQAVSYSLEPCEFSNWFSPGQWTFVQGSREEPSRLPFPSSSFDCVASVGVLEHVRETGGTEVGSLQELRRVLNPDGILICCHLPNDYSLIERLAAAVPGKYHHDVRFTRETINETFQAAGLIPVQITGYGFLPRNLWAKAPANLRNSEGLARLWDTLDHLLERMGAPVCQNFAVVATCDK